MTRPLLALSLCLLAATTGTAAQAAETCADPKNALGVSRIVEIDTKSGPLFGQFTKYEKEPRFLGPKEVVLTFDDGPLPRYTKPILEALDKFCTKATFFYVGKMALAYPDMVKEVMGRGHTVGTHTWSHPMNLRRQSLSAAEDQIERGFAAVSLAAGKPIAPFFRFPGLSDSPALLNYLQERGVGAFTVDVVSNDSYISSPQRLAQRTLAQVERQNGGIVLFHDIKASTAKALPTILTELKKRGFKIVLLRAKSTYEPLPELTAQLEAKLAKSKEKSGKAETSDNEAKKPELKPFYAAIAPSTLADEGDAEPAVSELAPEARERTSKAKRPKDDSAAVDTNSTDVQPAAKAPAKHKSAARKAAKRQTSSNEHIMSLSNAVSGQF